MASCSTSSPVGGEHFHFRRNDGADAVWTCCANGTGYWPVGEGGSCVPVDQSGKGHLLLLYYLIGGGILAMGVRALVRRKSAPQRTSQQTQIFESMSAEQRAAVLGIPPPRQEGEPAGGWREKLDSPSLTWTWIGVAIAVSNFCGSWLANTQQSVLTLSESNAISDVDSVTSVIQDVFAFFEDGMTVLIGASVGAGDPAAAGTLTLLGYIAGLVFGLVGGGVGTAAAYSSRLMDVVIPAPVHQCAGIAATSAGVSGSLAGQVGLQALARPYWLISVWVWVFDFCNKVGTGVVLGTNSCFAFALATILQQATAIASFLAFAAADGIPNTAAVGLSNLVSSVVYFVAIAHGVFRGPASRLVPLPSRSALRSPETIRLARLAATSGAAMMVATVAAQAQATTTTQMLARMGTGLQYRATVFGTIGGNFWLHSMLGYAIRLSGSKFFGAELRGVFWWLVGLCTRGALLLGLAASISMVVFSDSAPWSFASENICELLQHPCGVSEYEQLYGNDFKLTYYIAAAYQTIGPLVAVLGATLYAAQNFTFVRNISAAGLGLLFVPLALLGYHMDSFLILYFAGMSPGLLTIIGCGWRLYHLWREPELEAKGRLSVNSREEGLYPSRGSINEVLADYRHSRADSAEDRRARTQQLATAREDDYRQNQQHGQNSPATELHESLM